MQRTVVVVTPNGGAVRYRLRPRFAFALAWLAMTVLAATLAIRPAVAFHLGEYPTVPKSWKVYGKSVQIGASLVTNYTDYRFNDKLLPQSSDTIKIAQKLPEDAVISSSSVYWAGSASDFGIDNTAEFTFADGAKVSLTADSCTQRNDPGSVGLHFYCRKDITTLLAAHPGNAYWNGTYSLGGVDAKVAAIKVKQAGDPPGFCPKKANGSEDDVCCQDSDWNCQARHASWSMNIVYDTKFSETTQRDVFLYDGFVLLDERPTSKGQISFNITDFLVGDPPEAQITYYAMEGDKQLGNPEQTAVWDEATGKYVGSTPDSPPCNTCYDFVEFNGVKLKGGAGNNEEDNIMNSSQEPGIDLDTFDVSAHVKTNDTSAKFLVSSGDGSLNDNNDPQVQAAGCGELFFYGYTVLQINRKAPNFKNPVTKFTVNAAEASPGDVLTYTMDLLNNGPLDAENTTFSLNAFPPAGTEYVAGSTIVDGKTIADSGAQSALQTGLKLGSLTNPAGGDSVRKVTFKVKIKAVPGVTQVDATGTIAYTYIGMKYSDSIKSNTTSVKIVAPKLQTPTLTVTPGSAKPGDTATWTLTFVNVSTTTALLGFSWSTPKEAQLVNKLDCTFDTLLPITKITISTTGGSNGTGSIDASNVQLGPGKTATCKWNTTVLTAAQLTAKGVAPINGHVVLGQAQITVDGKTLPSDDPAQPGANDATPLTLAALTSFVTSQKSVADLSPDTPLLPGDSLQFTITLVNSGLVDGKVTVTDPLPSALSFVSSQSPELTLVGTTVQGKDILVGAGQTKSLLFTAKLKPDTPPGSTFANVATLSPSDGGAPTVVQTPTQTVQGGPDLATSLKTVQDLNGGDLEPGDTLAYTITVKNTGKVASGALQVADPIDGNLEGVAGIDNGGALDAATAAVLWSVPAVAAGASQLLHFTAKVKALTPNGTAIPNVATISGSELPNPTQVTATVKVQAQPNISLFSETVVSSAGATYHPGDNVTYTLQVQNTGNGAVSSATVTSTYDAALEIVSVTAGGVVLSGHNVSWNVGTLQKGAPPKVLTVHAKLVSVIGQGKTISNQASLTGDGLGAPVASDDPAQPGKSDPTVFTVLSAPILTTSVKSYVDLNGGVVQGGDKVQFKIAVANTGNSPATNVVVTDVLAPQLTDVQVSGGSFNAAQKTVTWNGIASLLPGAPQELTLTATVDKATPSGTVVQNLAKIAWTEQPLTAQTNTISFSVQNLPDFGLSTKAVNAATILAGDKVTWTIVVQNSGNAAGTGVVAKDAVPKEVENVVVPAGSFDAGSGTATWNVGAMAAGEQKTLTLTGNLKKPLDKGLQVCNQAKITAAENPTPSATSPPGTTPSQGGTPTCFVSDSQTQIVFTKDVFHAVSGAQLNQATVKPKTPVRYALKVADTGTAVAKNIVVTDVIPQELNKIKVLDGGAFDAATRTITWPTVASLGIGPSDGVTLRFEAETAAGLDNGFVLANQGSLTHQGLATPQKSDDPITPALVDKTVLNIASNIDFSKTLLTVVDGNGGVTAPGDQLDYTLTLLNEGDGTGKDVTVHVPIDARLEGVSADSGGVVAGGILTFKLGTLAPTQGATLHFKAKLKVPQVSGAVISLQGQVSAQGFAAPVLTDANLATVIKEPTSVTVTAKPNLTTSVWSHVDHNGGTLEPGDLVTLILTLKNTGDALALQTAAKMLWQAQALVDVQPMDGGVLQGSAALFAVPVISSSPTGDIQLRAMAKLAPSLTDGAKVVLTSEITGVLAPPTLTLTVSAKPRFETSTLVADDESGWVAKPGNVAPGHTVRLEVLVKNSGKVPATNLKVTLPLPAKLGNPQLVTPGALQGTAVQWTLPTLAAGGSALMVVKATVAATAVDGDKLPLQLSISTSELAAPFTLNGQTLAVVQKPILKLTKTFTDLNGKHLFPGDALRFSLTAANAGNAPAQHVVFTDTMAAALTGLQVESGGTLAGQTASWVVPTLAPGQSVTVTLQAKIAPNVASGSAILNQASVKADNSEAALSNALQVPVNYPTLSVTTALMPVAPAVTPVRPGDAVTLQVQIKVVGAQGASDVLVFAPIDANVFDVTNLKGATFDEAAKAVRWSAKDTAALATMVGGGTATLEVGLKVKATAKNGTTVKVQSTAREGETQIAYLSNTAQLDVSAVPDLKITKTVTDLNGGKVAPLDVLRYEIRVEPTGKAAAQDLTVGDTLDAALEVVAIGQGGVANGQKVTWSSKSSPELKTILPGTSVTLALDVRVKASVQDGVSIANQAFVQAAALQQPLPSDDPTTPTPGDQTVVKIRSQSPLDASTKLGKDDNGGALVAGDTVTWRIAVAATGTADAKNVKLFDGVPAGMDYVAGSTMLAGVAVPEPTAGVLPLIAGIAVQSPGSPAGSLTPGLDRAAIVTFKTRLRAEAHEGGTVSNTATATADGAPPTPIGPAELSIGKGASLRSAAKMAQVVDTNGNGLADVGEEIVYTLTVKNTGVGTGEQVAIEDPLPNTAKYVGGSLQVDGKAQTDADDADVGRFDATTSTVRVQIATLLPGVTVKAAFRARIVAGPSVSNQAIIKAKGLQNEPSDADGDDSNGNQPTVTPVGAAVAMLQVVKTVQDDNGGSVQAGDWLRYTIALQNPGSLPLAGLDLVDALRQHLSPPAAADVLAPPGAAVTVTPATKTNAARVAIGGLTIQPGETATISLKMQLAGDLADGTVVCNGAQAKVAVNGGELAAEAKQICVTVGSMAGEGMVSGTVFEDVGADDGVFLAGKDLFFPNFRVTILPPEGESGGERSGVADAQGRFRIANVAPGWHRVRVTSPSGVVFTELAAQNLGNQKDLLLKPTGRLYDSNTGALVAGVQVFLRYDASDPVAPGQMVADGDLPTGQQGQRTDGSGAYQFTPKAGRAYRIEVAGAAGGFAFPSRQRAPESDLVALDQAGIVVADALPHVGAQLPRYLTRFSLLGSSATPPPPPPQRGARAPAPNGPPTPRHNHLPVESLTSAIHVAVHLSKAQAQIGELVYVVVKANNASTVGIGADPVTGAGGAELRNVLPPGLGLVPGSVRLVLKPGGTGPEVKLPVAPVTGPQVAVRRISATTGKTVGLDLPSGGELTLTLAAVVLPAARAGNLLHNSAQLFETGGAALSNRADATLLVQADPMFDRGMVMGKVFCDGNGDGQQQDGEEGLYGARVYVDSGAYANADVYGRLHFKNLTPGNHLFKIDVETLPPGSAPTTDDKLLLYVTPGIALPLTFGVRCALEAMGPTRVEVVQAPVATLQAPLPGPGVVHFDVEASGLLFAIDGRKLPSRWLRAALAYGDRPAELAADVTSVALVSTAALQVWTQAAGGFARHALEVREVGEHGRLGPIVLEQQDVGDPPREIRLRDVRDAKGGLVPALQQLGADRHYVARVRAETAYGSAAWSAPMPFEVRRNVEDRRARSWSLARGAPRLQINGRGLGLDAQGRAALDVARPGDGRVFVSLRAADGSGRDEFMTLPKGPSSDAVAPPRAPDVPKPVAPPATPAASAAPAALPLPPRAPVVRVPNLPRLEALSPTSGALVPVPLAGALGNLSLAGVALQPAVQPLAVTGPAAPVPLAQGRILGRVLLQTASLPPQAKRAAVVLLDREGRVRSRSELSVPVPANFFWDPSDVHDLLPGRYGLAIEVLAAADAGAMQGFRSVPIALELASGGVTLLPPGDPDKVVRAELFDKDGAPTASMREWLNKTAEALRSDADHIAMISVHDNGATDTQTRSERAATNVAKVLQAQGVRADRLIVFGLGNQVADFKLGMDKLGPHRVEVRLRGLATGTASTAEPKRFGLPEALWVDNERVTGPSLTLPTTVKVHAGEPTLVTWQRADGSAALWQRVFAAKPPGPAAEVPPRGIGLETADFGADLLDAVAARNRAAQDAPADKSGPAEAQPAASASAAVAQAEPASPQPATLALAATGSDLPPAADLQVWLPKQGLELGSTELPIRGVTKPGNKITIQGQDVPVDADGHFHGLATLAAGKGTVTVVSTDPQGNRATLERPVVVQQRQFFLMAIADGSISHVGAHLAEVGQDGGYQSGNLQLFGRGAVYLKGRISGEYLGLKDLRYTAHLDTAKDPNLQDFATNLLDPTRFYPVYGDASLDVQDAQSRGKLYILVEADGTRLQVGNLRAAVHGIELLRYDRALYGALVDLRRVINGFDTRIQAYAASQDKAVARRTDVLRGTGGSLYYLSSRDVLDGSDQVSIVIRDRSSGMELGRVPMVRNVDYTMDSRQGRIVFKSPVSGAMDAATIIGQNGLAGQHLNWNGHPVYVEAIYEARGVVASDRPSFGGQIQEKVLGGKIAVGASYVQEGRGDGQPVYRVAGADATVQFAPRTKATVEYAVSQARDSLVAVSDDGGLTFGTPTSAAEKLASGKTVQGQAFKVGFDTDFRDFFADEPAAAAATSAAGQKVAAASRELGRIRAQYQWVQQGFQSGGAITAQGQQKIVFDSAFHTTAKNALSLRYDGSLTDAPQAQYGGAGLTSLWGSGQTANSGSFSNWHRHTIGIQDTYKWTDRWMIFGAGTYGYGYDALGHGHTSETLALGAQYRATDRLTVRADQQAIVAGDPAQFRSDMDHFATALGADYKIAKSLAFTATERIGWGGQNATAAGLRTELDSASSLYLQQRIEDTYDRGHTASSTVVGAESRYGPDKTTRAFGEYQIDALNAGRMNRATMGVGKRFELQKGLHLDAGYERQQSFGGTSGVASRDALSLGGEWLRADLWKLTSRQEVRLDDGDKAMGGIRKLQVLSLNNAQAAITKEFTLFGRANYMRTQNQTSDQLEAEALEATLGGAFRPIRTNWLNVIGKYTRLIEMRPSNANTGSTDRAIKDILSLEPIAELPLRLQFSQKVAWRRALESFGDLGATASTTMLFVSRLGWHALGQIDLAAEYRFLTTTLTGDLEHGALVETAWIIQKAMRIGAGYNFTHFRETMAGDIQRATDGGFFLRLTGMY